MLRLRTERHRAVAEQKSRAIVLVREMVVDCFRALRAAQGIDHELIVDARNPDHVGHHVLGYAALRFRPDAAVQAHDPVLDLNVDVVDVEPSVLGQSLAHDAPKLAIAQVPNVVRVLEVVRHCSPHGGCPYAASPAGRRRYRKNRYERPSETPRLLVQSFLDSLRCNTLVPSLAVV